MINRRKIRTIFNTTDTTSQTTSVVSSTLNFNMITTDKFYIGHHDKFACRYFYMNVVNAVASVVTVKYWNGTIFTPVLDLIDQTSGFFQSGFLSWINQEDWATKAQTPITDEELYWIELTVSVNMTAGAKLQAVMNLFSDDVMLRAYYPELVSDSRFLPPSRTDFVEQHEMAKNRVVQRLIQKKLITQESQIVDINAVAEAAVHSCAELILNPIAQSDFQKDQLKRAQESMESSLTNVYIPVDSNKNAILSTSERKPESGFIYRR